MSDPNSTAPRSSKASRYLSMFLLGLVIGIVATVMAMRALDARKDHFPGSVMQVQQWHLTSLGNNVKQNRCGPTDTLPHLQALRTMANDIEPAFPGLADDKRLIDHASAMRASLAAALANPPLACAGVGAVTAKVGDGCKACHQDFRN